MPVNNDANIRAVLGEAFLGQLKLLDQLDEAHAEAARLRQELEKAMTAKSEDTGNG